MITIHHLKSFESFLIHTTHWYWWIGPVTSAWQTFVTGFVKPDKNCSYSLCCHQWWLSLLQTVWAHQLIQQQVLFDRSGMIWSQNLAWQNRVTICHTFVTWQTWPMSGFDILKCSNMVSSVQSHDLGTIGALETAFLENRFSILARMRRVMRTHPLKIEPVAPLS